MDFTPILLVSFLLIFISIKFLFINSTRKLNLPPSPAHSLPFIGHLYLLKQPVHRTLLSLSHSLGNTPIFHLRLGNQLVYVASSHSVAEECFTRNDVVLANRPELIIGKHVAYNNTVMVSASYGNHWRNLRRIAAVEIFSSHRVSTFMSIRKEEIRRLITYLSRNSLHSLVVPGTDTSAVTLEWALSNLLNHPKILEKARAEIDEKIGSDRLLEESDIESLPYLQHIVSETFRLHPPVPLLLPHFSSDDCKVAGYDMPRGTMLLTNVWAMHRDPGIWEEAERFKPERFEKEGEAQKLMPFGMGRRACPGVELGKRLVSLALGCLVQCFEWERVGEELVDMMEDKGLTMPKATPLRAKCKARVVARKII